MTPCKADMAGGGLIDRQAPAWQKSCRSMEPPDDPDTGTDAKHRPPRRAGGSGCGKAQYRAISDLCEPDRHGGAPAYQNPQTAAGRPDAAEGGGGEIGRAHV